MKNSPSKKMNNYGQALVEFALVLPILLILVFGITEFGRYLYLKNTATNGARQGARVAATTINWAQQAPIFSAATSLIHGATVTILPIAQPTTGATVTVTITKPFASIVPNFITTPTSITASATMRYE
jgi:Flp pilus assembly protein TadG